MGAGAGSALGGGMDTGLAAGLGVDGGGALRGGMATGAAPRGGAGGAAVGKLRCGAGSVAGGSLRRCAGAGGAAPVLRWVGPVLAAGLAVRTGGRTAAGPLRRCRCLRQPSQPSQATSNNDTATSTGQKECKKVPSALGMESGMGSDLGPGAAALSGRA